LRTFDRVIANPMWNQKEYAEKDYDADDRDAQMFFTEVQNKLLYAVEEFDAGAFG